jgi:hypothetical protein
VTDTCRETRVGKIWLNPENWPFALALAVAADDPEAAEELAAEIEVCMQWDGGEWAEDLLPLDASLVGP